MAPLHLDVAARRRTVKNAIQLAGIEEPIEPAFMRHAKEHIAAQYGTGVKHCGWSF